MELIKIEEVKELAEVADALVRVVAGIKKSLADGFQPGQDLPEVVVLAIKELGEAINGMEKIPAEVKGNKAMAAKVMACMAIDMVEALV